MFASRLDLLARSNARRLGQLAIPADRDMIVTEAAFRVAMNNGSLSGYSADDQVSLALAMTTIDNALADADALLLSYGIPDTVQTTLLARLASTVALYYLQGSERMTEEVLAAYKEAIRQLELHAKGLVSLVPVVSTESASDEVAMYSGPSRYSES